MFENANGETSIFSINALLFCEEASSSKILELETQLKGQSIGSVQYFAHIFSDRSQTGVSLSYTTSVSYILQAQQHRITCLA